MAENVYEVLKGNYSELVKTLDTNEDVCRFLQLVYSHLHHIAIDASEDPADMICEVDIVLERLLKISVKYKAGEEGPKKGVGGKLPSQRNMNLVHFLGVNTNVKELAIRVVETLERWLAEKPWKKKQGFSKIRLENARLWKELVFTAEIVMQFQFDELVAAKMNWDMDEPEQPAKEEGRIIIP